MAQGDFVYLVLTGQVPYRVFGNKGDMCAWLLELEPKRRELFNILRMQDGGAYEVNLNFVSAERVLRAWGKKDE